MSSSEESENEYDEWTTRDSNTEQLAASILDKKDELLGDDQSQDYLAIMRRATRKISTIKQLQQEFPVRVRNTITVLTPNKATIASFDPESNGKCAKNEEKCALTRFHDFFCCLIRSYQCNAILSEFYVES